MTRVFEPKFYITESIEECADTINKPHEDYPLRVDKTIEIIRIGLEKNFIEISEGHIKAFHSILFGEYNPKHIRRGDYRTVEVTVGGSYTPEPYKIPEMMTCIMPISYNGNLEEWYKNFETIHPFQDGNGRIGGIVIAILSYLKNKKFLTHKQ